jgi:mono/diheme cytochrome c family protein
MVRTAAYDAFAANPNFADGKTLQVPVPGTIRRGLMPMHYQAAPPDALRAGDELQSPLAASDAVALKRGEAVFTAFCAACHGPGGPGNGPVAARGYPPPVSLTAEKAAKMKDGQIFHILTYGQGNMPSYATQISREDRWKVILYVRALQSAAPKPAGGQP